MTLRMKQEMNTLKTKCMKSSTQLNLLKKLKTREKENLKILIKKIAESLDTRKTKMVVEFNDHESASIKSFAVKKHSSI